jgi:hypothetical protein
MVVDILRQLVECLVGGDFDAAERLTQGVRLTSSDMQQAIRDYGGTLVTPPDTALLDADVIEVAGANPRTWSVCFDLWTKEQGTSDLSLELTVKEGSPEPKVELDNLHVL